MRFTINHTDTTDLVRRLKVILGRLGYRVEPASPARVGVGELAKLVNRSISNVSKRLRSPHCPQCKCYLGPTGRILELEPNASLISWLTNSTPGQRHDLAKL